MGINVTAKKRGWGWDEANSRLGAYVDGREAFSIRATGGIGFNEHAGRTGEGTYLFANGLSIGMATPGDCQGIKMEFDYGVTPSALTGSGKMVHGLDIKMTMDQEWNFTSNDRNATVRGARIQGLSENDVGGRVMGIYSNAKAGGTGKEIEGIVGGTDAGPGIISIEARTELASGATITTPAIVGLLCWHNSPAGSTLAGDYRAIQIDQPRLPGLTGKKYGIYFGDSNVVNSAYYLDAEIAVATKDANGLPCIIVSGAATSDGAITTDVGADTLWADGSLYISVSDGAGKLFQKQNDVWTDIA